MTLTFSYFLVEVGGQLQKFSILKTSILSLDKHKGEVYNCVSIE